MKNTFHIMILFAIISISCTSESSIKPKSESIIESNSKSPLDGTWIWIETTGIGFDGLPYYQNPVSEGYSQKYNFYDASGREGKLQTYRNEEKHLFYQYSYGVDENGNQITLDRLGNALPDIYSLEIREMNSGTHLFLRGKECCDRTIEHHFILGD